MAAHSFYLLLLCLALGSVTSTALAQVANPANNSDSVEDDETASSTISLSNPLDDQSRMVDRLVVLRGEEGLSNGEVTSLTLTMSHGEPPRLVLTDYRERAYPRRGTWKTAEIEAEYPFTELLPSWNVDAPPDTGATFEVRVRDAESQEWSPYLYIGQWGRTLHWPDRTIEFEGGKVHVDILKLKRPADAFQMQVRLMSYDLKRENYPAIRQLAISYSGRIDDDAELARLKKPAIVDGDWARSLPVPFNAQGDNPSEISGSTCSPTSTRMVMAYRGIDKHITDVAMNIWDNEYGIFGVWNRSVAYAASEGLQGYLTRVRSWDEVKSYIAQGQPIIASIRFRRGEFPSNPMRSTNGHLIVVRGMTPEGDPIVNDPANRATGNGIVFKKEELAKAWFDKGGVAYIIGPKISE